MTTVEHAESAPSTSVDIGFTHIALPVKNIEHSVRFYRTFAAMHTVHERTDQAGAKRVVWLADGTRPFVLVLIETEQVDHVLGGAFCHLGVACRSRESVDALCALAREMHCPVIGPTDSGPPVGRPWAIGRTSWTRTATTSSFPTANWSRPL